MISLRKEHIDLFSVNECYVACSGGIDSVVLVHLLLAAGITPGIIHVNYHLRGAASDGDEAFVRDLAIQYNLPLIVEHADLSALKHGSGNIQQAARDARYAVFRKVIAEEGARVLLAQHLDDQLETFYLALARNAGVRGLACMPWEKNSIVRPLLHLSKEALRAYAEANDINWREDASNAESDYNRNKLRNLILPELKAAIPTLTESIPLLIAQFQQSLKESEARVADLLTEILKDGFIPNTVLKNCIETEVLLLFEALGLTPAQLTELLILQRKGSFVEAGENAHDVAAIYKGLGGFELALKTLPPLPQLLIEEVAALPTVFTKTELYLDADKLKGELQLRRLQTGDRIRIVGMQGSKLLSDILNDHKAGIRAKQTAVVVTDGTSILWFPGYTVAPTAIASANSSRILKLNLSFS
jgi:tRNA(Ile)-lysidine synthase